jgi:hypothetical protein
MHGIAIFSDILRHIIRCLDSVKSVIGIRIEGERVAVDSEAMNASYPDVGLKIQVVPRDLIFNLDET